jgi:predicted ATPase
MNENEASVDSFANQSLPEIGSYGNFIGRESQLSEVSERLKNHRLVALVGPGGMGKTRLALEIIKRKRGDAVHDAAIAFVSLELVTENSEGAILDALVSDLKLIPGDAEGLRAALVKRLSDIPVLLVLDNCETAHSSVASLVRYLLSECPKLRILATSQHQLGLLGLEAVYELPPLSVPDDRPGSLDYLEDIESYKLFVARAQMTDASWTPEAGSESSLRRVLQLTDGIPLAIEIVAAWAPLLSLKQICEDLLKTPLGSITNIDQYNSMATKRHQSMLRCLEWSISHLTNTSPKDAAGFKRLGVFAGRFTEDAVGKVCDIDAPRELLAHLVKTSFVHPCLGTNPRRYSMLRFTRAFAQDKARVSGIEEDLIVRHVDFFFNLASPLNDKGEWESVPLTSPEHDWPDLLAAADAASRIGNHPAVWQISRVLSPFLQQRGLWSERERLNRAAVKAASDANYWLALERSLLDLGIILEAQGLWSKAADQYRRSLYFANRNATPNPSHQAMALQRLGNVLTRMGDSAGAERAGRRLREVNQLLDQPKAKTISLDKEGKMFEDRGDLANAEAKYREAFQIRESVGDDAGLAHSRSNIGTILTLRGVWETAEAELRGSLDFWASRNMAREQGIILHLLADLFRRQGRYPEARDYCDQSLKYREDDPKGRAVTLSLLARILRIQRDFENAVIASQRNRELCRSIGDTEGESMALDEIGTTYASQRLWDEALDAFTESLRLKESVTRRDIVGLGITFDRIAQIHARRGNWAQAQAAYTNSLRFLKEARRGIPAAVTLMNVAMMHAAQGQKGAALKALDEAIVSLESEQSGKAVLQVARDVRIRIDHKMHVGIPWIHWRDAAFNNQTIFIRKRYSHERNAKLWREVASGYEALAEDFFESGQQMEAALALNEMGSAYRHLSDFRRSEEAIRRALSIFEEIALPLGQAASWHKLGDLFADQHRWSDAEEAYAQSIKLKLECSDDDGEAISQDALAVLLINTGRFVEAERAANRSWEILSKSGSAWQKWHPLVLLLWIKVEEDDPTTAQSLAARLAEAVRGIPELEAAASELRAMTEAGDWDGIKTRLARTGITGPAEIPAPTPALQEPNAVSTAPCSLRRRGQGWEICFKGDGPFQLKDTVGVQYLATLLGSDGSPIHCSRLASSKGRAVVSSNLTAENTPLLTPEAKRAYHARLAELEEQIATAVSHGKVDEVIDLKEEVAGIVAALEAAHDKLGDDQSLMDDGDRVRNAVCNPIRTLRNLLRDDTQTREIGLHLIDQVALGYTCAYPKDSGRASNGQSNCDGRFRVDATPPATPNVAALHKR